MTFQRGDLFILTVLGAITTPTCVAPSTGYSLEGTQKLPEKSEESFTTESKSTICRSTSDEFKLKLVASVWIFFLIINGRMAKMSQSQHPERGS